MRERRATKWRPPYIFDPLHPYPRLFSLTNSGPCSRHHANRKKEGITRQKYAHQESRFSEHDPRQQEVAIPAGYHLPQQVNQFVRIGKTAPDFE